MTLASGGRGGRAATQPRPGPNLPPSGAHLDSRCAGWQLPVAPNKDTCNANTSASCDRRSTTSHQPLTCGFPSLPFPHSPPHQAMGVLMSIYSTAASVFGDYARESNEYVNLPTVGVRCAPVQHGFHRVLARPCQADPTGTDLAPLSSCTSFAPLLGSAGRCKAPCLTCGAPERGLPWLKKVTPAIPMLTSGAQRRVGAQPARPPPWRIRPLPPLPTLHS